MTGSLANMETPRELGDIVICLHDIKHPIISAGKKYIVVARPENMLRFKNRLLHNGNYWVIDKETINPDTLKYAGIKVSPDDLENPDMFQWVGRGRVEQKKRRGFRYSICLP